MLKATPEAGYAKGRLTRSGIISSAVKAFAEKGYNQTSLRDILADLNITKGAFYHHWRNKQDLAIEILRSVRHRLRERVARHVSLRRTGREKIEAYLELLRTVAADPEWRDLRLIPNFMTQRKESDRRLSAELHAFLDRFREQWTQMIGQAQREGDVRGDLPAAALADVILSALAGIHLATSAPSQEIPYDHLTRCLHRLLFPVAEVDPAWLAPPDVGLFQLTAPPAGPEAAPAVAPNARGRYRRGRATRQEILDSAIGVFARYGYHMTTLNDIVKRIGITKGAFYYHWRRKEDLALEILDHIEEAFRKRFEPRIVAAANGRERVAAYLDVIDELNVGGDRSKFGLFITFAAEYVDSEHRLAARMRESIERFRDQWTIMYHGALCEGHLITCAPADCLAALTVGALFGVRFVSRLGLEIENTRLLGGTLRALLLESSASRAAT